MKIYTKTGDSGQTSLYGGKRVGKDSLRIRAYGDVDELNAILGLCAGIDKGKKSAPDLKKIFARLQHQLFIVGADLAAHLAVKTERIHKEHVAELEEIIDRLAAKLPSLNNFIYPGGTALAAHLHLARTVCRRAEREVVALSKKEKINPLLIPYLNRLSDLLFVMARRALKNLPAKIFKKH